MKIAKKGIENLKMFTREQSREKAKENGKKGGIASGISKRKNKTFKELANKFLNSKIQPGELKNNMLALGITDEECTNKMALLFSCWVEGIKGNIKAIETIRDTAGEKPKEQIESTNIEMSYEDYIKKIEDIDEY